MSILLTVFDKINSTGKKNPLGKNPQYLSNKWKILIHGLIESD